MSSYASRSPGISAAWSRRRWSGDFPEGFSDHGNVFHSLLERKFGRRLVIASVIYILHSQLFARSVWKEGISYTMEANEQEGSVLNPSNCILRTAAFKQFLDAVKMIHPPSWATGVDQLRMCQRSCRCSVLHAEDVPRRATASMRYICYPWTILLQLQGCIARSASWLRTCSAPTRRFLGRL